MMGLLNLLRTADRRRTRLAHVLKDFGERVQYSIFECKLEEAPLARLQAREKRHGLERRWSLPEGSGKGVTERQGLSRVLSRAWKGHS